MEFGMSRRIKPKEKYVRISVKEIWRNLDGPLKNQELWSSHTHIHTHIYYKRMLTRAHTHTNTRTFAQKSVHPNEHMLPSYSNN